MMEEAIRELARFLGLTYEETKAKVDGYTVGVAAGVWGKNNPQTPEEVERHYREDTDYYLYELIPWNYGIPAYQQRVAPLLLYRNRKVLDLGAGIGSLCIALTYAGNQVTYCDISERLSAFARQRFADRGMNIPVVHDLRGQRDFDIITAIDFFEHVHKDRLLGLLKDVAGCLKDGGFLYTRSNFGQQDIFPMHYNHSEYFLAMAKEAGLAERPNGDLVKGGLSHGVQVGLPVLGNVSDEWLYSFLGMQKPLGTKLTKISNRPADQARNEIIRKLEKDWLFFMDSDQTFPPDCLMRLLSWDLPIVSGLYFKSPGKPVPHVYKYAYNDGHHQYQGLIDPIGRYLSRFAEQLKGQVAIVLPGKREDLIECDGIGVGCLLVHRRVFQAIEPPWFKYNEDANVGEDFYFCRKVQEAGFKIYVDPGVVCGHREKTFVGAEHFLAWATTEGKKLPDIHPYPWGDEGLVISGKDTKGTPVPPGGNAKA